MEILHNYVVFDLIGITFAIQYPIIQFNYLYEVCYTVLFSLF